MKTLILTILLAFNANDKVISEKEKETTEAFVPINQYALELYNEINESDLNYESFEIAIKGYSNLASKNKLKNKKYLTIVDMSKSANTERMFIIDVEKRTLIYKKLVAHGMKTGDEFASHFSNEEKSHQSSIGFYITGELYNGRHNLSMKLDGQEYSNDNARSRGVVVHSADYVSCDYIESNGRLGRSYGCPAIEKEGYQEIVEMLHGGSCYFIYYPSRSYLSHSKIVNSRKEYLLTYSGDVSISE